MANLNNMCNSWIFGSTVITFGIFTSVYLHGINNQLILHKNQKYQLEIRNNLYNNKENNLYNKENNLYNKDTFYNNKDNLYNKKDKLYEKEDKLIAYYSNLYNNTYMCVIIGMSGLYSFYISHTFKSC